MTNRTTRNGGSTEVSWPDVGSTEGFGNEYARHIRNLYRYAILPLSSVSGADTITASVEPSLATEGLLSGMKFSVVWSEDNTGPATLNIDGHGAASILSADGSEMEAGDLVSGARAILEYDGSDFRVLGGGASSVGVSPHSRQVFTASGTWINPGAGMAFITLCGGGGSGGAGLRGTSSGGQGGAYLEFLVPCELLDSSVAVTVGDGGVSKTSSAFNSFSPGSDGSRSAFGDFGAPGGKGGTSVAGSGASTPAVLGVRYMPGGEGAVGDAPSAYDRGTGGGGGGDSINGESGAGSVGKQDLGNGGAGAFSSGSAVTATSGTFPGGGGGGASLDSDSGTAISGAGAPGRVTVDVWG
ncbi:hypothetical protein [Celeribacter ethanolicus]|uniref:glycine-rich domain-containing protein n=1 Tax=Celeribacter ethanolicus TaxID=1758178 RepID=UPI0012FDA5F4|nr:hypothetical protein [Celeribacter ethanolicus]